MKRRQWKTWTWIAAILALSATAAVLMQNHARERGQESFTACHSIMKNTATALEMYSTDNVGHYPPSLAALVPTYMRTMPTCPSTGVDTYSASYAQASSPMDRFTFYCQGDNHRAVGLAPNFPQYTTEAGIVDR